MKRQSLFITNGDSAAALINQTALDGYVLPWRDPMHHGPFPADLTRRQLSQTRARYLAGDLLDVNTVEADLLQRDSTLHTRGKYTETVLWFEHDLLDQLQILQILDAIEDPDNVSMICIDRFPGIAVFRGLGQLDSTQIRSLYSSRLPISLAQLAQAKAVWTLFRSNNPTQLAAFTTQADCRLPFLQPALIRHLQEYPWTSDGLSRTERQLLQLLKNNDSSPGQLFVDNMSLENCLFIGDWSTYRVIDALSSGNDPLLAPVSGEYQRWATHGQTADSYRHQLLRLTATGDRVLSQALHGSEILHRDMWLGGVHIVSGENHWQWDDSTATPVRVTGLLP